MWPAVSLWSHYLDVNCVKGTGILVCVPGCILQDRVSWSTVVTSSLNSFPSSDVTGAVV